MSQLRNNVDKKLFKDWLIKDVILIKENGYRKVITDKVEWVHTSSLACREDSALDTSAQKI